MIVRMGEAVTRPTHNIPYSPNCEIKPICKRRNQRLKGYDYRQNGAYFVTICTHQRSCIFGAITDGAVTLNAWGKIAQDEWQRTERLRPNVQLDAFVVMPNHLHGILLIADDEAPSSAIAKSSARTGGNAPGSLGQIIGLFKSTVTKRIRKSVGSTSIRVWQRNYHEHVIRTESDRQRVREYIIANPARWADDD